MRRPADRPRPGRHPIEQGIVAAVADQCGDGINHEVEGLVWRAPRLVPEPVALLLGRELLEMRIGNIVWQVDIERAGLFAPEPAVDNILDAVHVRNVELRRRQFLEGLALNVDRRRRQQAGRADCCHP